MLDMITDFGDLSYHFVPRRDGILCHSPLIVDDTQIAMANTGVVNINFNLMGFQLTRIILEGLKFSLGFKCCKGFIMMIFLLVVIAV